MPILPRRVSSVFLAVFAAGLTGCSGSGAVIQRSGVVSLPELFRAGAVIDYGSLHCSGSFEKSVSGNVRLQLEEPPSLAGLDLSLSDGVFESSLGELRFQVSSSVQPPESALSLLNGALNALNGVSFRIPSGEAPYQFYMQGESGRLQVVVAPGENSANFVPQSISIETLAFRAQFV